MFFHVFSLGMFRSCFVEKWAISISCQDLRKDMKPATPSSFADTVATRCKAAKVAHQGLETLPNVRQSFNGAFVYLRPGRCWVTIWPNNVGFTQCHIFFKSCHDWGWFIQHMITVILRIPSGFLTYWNWWFSMAMLNNQMVVWFLFLILSLTTLTYMWRFV